MKIGYRLFNGGINYRDDVGAVNELRDANNIYWDGSLTRRSGYVARNAELQSPDTGNFPSSGIKIIDHIRLKTDTGSDQYFLFCSLLDTAGATNALAVYHCSGLPNSTAETFSVIGTDIISAGLGHIITPWDTGSPLDVEALGNKVWIAMGLGNPYCMYYSTTGSSWSLAEVPLCLISNTGDTGDTGGVSIINNSTEELSTAAQWAGAKIVKTDGRVLFLTDGRDIYWAANDGETQPDYVVYPSSAGTTALSPGTLSFADMTSEMYSPTTVYRGSPGWDASYLAGTYRDVQAEKASVYNKYFFMTGKGGVVSFYMRNLALQDYNLVIETRQGCWGRTIACDAGIFYVGKDGIYGFDGSASHNLSKKIWTHVKGEHTTIPDDFELCSLAYYDGYIWISFPNGTNAEVYKFDPDLIYADEHGDSYAPLYRYTYTISTSTGDRSAIGIEQLREYDGHIFGVSNSTIGKGNGTTSFCHIVELESSGKDWGVTTAGLKGINWSARTVYDDQNLPGIKKSYQQVTVETNEGIADGTTDGAYAVQLYCYRDYSSGADEYGYSASGFPTSNHIGVDLEYANGGHAYKTLDVPYSASGYSLDGNSLSVEIKGLTTSVTPTTGGVTLYGIDVQYVSQARTLEEVSS